MKNIIALAAFTLAAALVVVTVDNIRLKKTCAVLDAHGNTAMSLRDWTQVQKQRETD